MFYKIIIDNERSIASVTPMPFNNYLRQTNAVNGGESPPEIMFLLDSVPVLSVCAQ